MSDLTYCLDCGMPVAANEYHPFAACLMFKACGNTMVVRMNLDAIINRATAAPVVVGEDLVRRAVCEYNLAHYSGIDVCCEDAMRAALAAVLEVK